MPTVRRIQFDEWWLEFTAEPTTEEIFRKASNEAFAWIIWQAAAKLYGGKFDHFKPGKPCEDRLKALEIVKDTSYTKMRNHYEQQLGTAFQEVRIRKEVHRDDYIRAGILLAALKRIMKLAEATLRIGMGQSPTFDQIEEIAREAIVETWGMSPTKHCDKHGSYRPSCSDCRAIGKSRAREDDGPTTSDIGTTDREDQEATSRD
jgi:hypothetical protein